MTPDGEACLKRYTCLMRTERTFFRSVNLISIFPMPSIFSMRMPLLTALATSAI